MWNIIFSYDDLFLKKNEFENFSSTLELGYLFDYFAIYSIIWSNFLFDNIIQQIIILP